MRSAVRLIAGDSTSERGRKLLRAGIEIRLDPGWKTFWRYPGDSGVPPRFNFARSENLDSVQVLWPAPQSFAEGDAKSIGYSGDVIFPLRVLPRDPNRPVRLRLNIDYAICERLCVPAEGSGELALGEDASSHEDALRQSERRVPQAATIGQRPGLAIETVARQPGRDRDRIMVDVRAPDAAKLELFAEGPTTDWALPIPEPVPGAPAGLQRFAFAIDGAPPGASPAGADVTLTAVAAEQAIEVLVSLDTVPVRGPDGE